jgi:hypothetical protein
MSDSSSSACSIDGNKDVAFLSTSRYRPKSYRGYSIKQKKELAEDDQCTRRKIAGLILLCLGALAIVLACLFAAGRFGGGAMGFVAGGLVVSSVILFVVAARLLIPSQPDTD